MTREQFIETHRHEIGGWILDAATAGRTGAELAMSLRVVMKKIDARLGAIYDQLVPPQPVKTEVNGKPQEKAKV